MVADWEEGDHRMIVGLVAVEAVGRSSNMVRVSIVELGT